MNFLKKSIFSSNRKLIKWLKRKCNKESKEEKMGRTAYEKDFKLKSYTDHGLFYEYLEMGKNLLEILYWMNWILIYHPISVWSTRSLSSLQPIEDSQSQTHSVSKVCRLQISILCSWKLTDGETNLIAWQNKQWKKNKLFCYAPCFSS